MLNTTGRNFFKVPFGLRDNRLFEPLQVESGLQCNCICPECGAALISRHSPSGKVTPNFSHATDTNCEGGLESALHRAAKQLINDRRELYLPELVACVSGYGLRCVPFQRREQVTPGKLVSLLRVRVEEALGCIRPDLIVNTVDQEILVEIAYTSFVTPEKLEQIKRRGIAAIEVDISGLAILNFEELAKLLFEATSCATWKFHPDMAARELALGEWLALDLAEDNLKWQQEQEVERLAQEKREAKRLATEKADEKLASALQARRVERWQKNLKKEQLIAERIAEFAATSNEKKFLRVLEDLGVSGEVIGTFLPIPVRGTSGIQAPTLVWQASVFSALIHRALRRENATLSAEAVRDWLGRRFKVDYTSKAMAVAVWDFLSGLANLQILHKLRKQDFLVAVPDFRSALEVAVNAKEERSAHLHCWREDWPSTQKANAVANVFSNIYGYGYCWKNVADLSEKVKGIELPSDTLAHFQRPNQGSMDAKALQRFFLSAGFTRLLC